MHIQTGRRLGKRDGAASPGEDGARGMAAGPSSGLLTTWCLIQVSCNNFLANQYQQYNSDGSAAMVNKSRCFIRSAKDNQILCNFIISPRSTSSLSLAAPWPPAIAPPPVQSSIDPVPTPDRSTPPCRVSAATPQPDLSQRFQYRASGGNTSPGSRLCAAFAETPPRLPAPASLRWWRA